MRIFKNKNFLVLLFLSSIIFVLFWQFFLKGLYPFPGNYLLAWYEPWKTNFSSNGTITIAHKPVADDVFRQLYPYKALTSEFLRNLKLPLWNPYNGSGMPLLATMHAGFLTPFNLLFVFLPQYLAWGLYVAIQPILLAFFTYVYARKIGIKFAGSLLASITFTLSGFVVARLLFGEYIYVLSMLPLLLYLIESFFENPKTKKIWIIPFAIMFMFFSGQPQIITYVLVFSICYYIYRINDKKIPINSTLPIPLLFIVGIGLAAIQILPTLELFRQSAISSSSSKFIFDRFLLPIQHLLSIFIPNYFGNQSTYNYWGSGDYIETIASVGLIPIFFAFLSIGRMDRKIDLRKFYFVVIVLTIMLTLDWFGTRLLYSIPIPIISTGIPTRIFALTTFCISILAGYGFDKWLNTNNLKEIKGYIIKFSILTTIIFTGTFIFYILKISCNNEFILDCRNIALRNTTLEIFVFIAALFFIFSYVLNKNFKKIAPIGVILLIIIIGIYNSIKFLPFSSKETILPQNDLIKELKKIKDARIFGLGVANIKTDFATYFKFYDPNYYDPLYNRRYGEFIDFANKGILSPTLLRSDVEVINDLESAPDVKQRRDRLFDLLSIKYLILKKPISKKLINNQIFWQDKDWIIVLNNKVLPFSFTLNKFEVIYNQKEILFRIFDRSFDPQANVILESKPDMKPTDQILVATDNYYPGWKAYVDKKETKIYRANYTFRAITLPKGNHTVEFRYEPDSLKIGAIISFFTLLLYIILFARFGPKVSGNKN